VKLQPQVSKEHYRLEKYVTHERWQSYFNQVREVLRYNPKTVLIIGPGDGIVVNILKGYGLEVETVDIESENNPNYLASVEDLASGQMPDKEYDAIVCCQVLEHLPYDKFLKCLESIKAYSKGVVIVSLPEKSLRVSLSLKLPRFVPVFSNVVIPFLWKKHRFDGEHYWELNSAGFSVKKVAADMSKVFSLRKFYRLKTNPYHFFFILENRRRKRIFILSDGKNPHTIKWVRSLAEREFDVFVFSLENFDFKIYEKFPNVRCFHAGFDLKSESLQRRFGKLSYLLALSRLKKEIADFSPDVVHAHYASSYGLLGALSGFKPFFLSVWGKDVYDFPHLGPLHKLVLKFNLSKASRIFSTSHVMAKETNQYTSREIEVIPFGVDLERFKPRKRNCDLVREQDIVVGTVKTLEEKYGVDVLIKAFAAVFNKTKNDNLKLLIVGRGSLELPLKALVKELGITDRVIFTGWVPVEETPIYHNILDIAVFPSRHHSESFGVAVVEASACEKPVIVSRVGGLPEVVAEEETGLVVPSDDVNALAMAIEKIVCDSSLSIHFGKNGRRRVMELYDWKNNLEKMISSYNQVEMRK
jgi:glycosyltransferase involved in cell wall biosynthesis